MDGISLWIQGEGGLELDGRLCYHSEAPFRGIQDGMWILELGHSPTVSGILNVEKYDLTTDIYIDSF